MGQAGAEVGVEGGVTLVLGEGSITQFPNAYEIPVIAKFDYYNGTIFLCFGFFRNFLRWDAEHQGRAEGWRGMAGQQGWAGMVLLSFLLSFPRLVFELRQTTAQGQAPNPEPFSHQCIYS